LRPVRREPIAYDWVTEPGTESGECGAEAKAGSASRELPFAECVRHRGAALLTRFDIFVRGIPIAAVAVVAVATIAIPWASPSALAASHGRTHAAPGRSEQVSPQDSTATREYLQARYALAQAVIENLPAQRALVQALAAQIAGECPGALTAAPRLGAPESSNSTSSASPSSAGWARKFAERRRQEEQSNDLAGELDQAFAVTAVTADRRAVQVFIDTVKPLRWSEPAVTQQLMTELRAGEETLRRTVPDVCQDMRAWAASGFKTLPTSTKAWVSERDAHDTVAERSVSRYSVPLTSVLVRYENAEDKTIITKTKQLTQDYQAAAPPLAGIVESVTKVLGFAQGADTTKAARETTSSTVLTRGRTAAGERLVAKLERKRTSADNIESGCSLELSIETSDGGGDGRVSTGGSGFTTCVSRTAETYRPSVNCSAGTLSVTVNTPSSVSRVRLRLSNGKQIGSRVIFVPRKLGGPYGMYYQVVRGPSPIPVSLVELNRHGKIVRSVSLPHIVECTKDPLKYFPGGRRALARATVPGGPMFTIVGEHYRFLGHSYFELKLELDEAGLNSSANNFYRSSEPVRSKLKWNSEMTCTPHPSLIIYSVLKNPRDAVLVRYSDQLAELRRVRIPAGMHAGGVLVYTAPPALPTELVLRGANGRTIASESLERLATETQETCEGEEEGPGPSSAPASSASPTPASSSPAP